MNGTDLLRLHRRAAMLLLLLGLMAGQASGQPGSGSKGKPADDKAVVRHEGNYLVKGVVLEVTREGDLSFASFEASSPCSLSCSRTTAIVTDPKAGMVKGKPFYVFTVANKVKNTKDQLLITFPTLDPLPPPWQDHVRRALATPMNVKMFNQRSGGFGTSDAIRKGDTVELSIRLNAVPKSTLTSLEAWLTIMPGGKQGRGTQFSWSEKAPAPELAVTSASPKDEVVVKEEDIKVNRRPPIAYKPLEPIDPKTGKLLPGNQVVTTPSGVQTTVDEVYKEANRLEKEFNKLGYSLRTPGVETISVSPVNEAKNREEEKKLKAAIQPLRRGAKPIPTPEEQKKAFDKSKPTGSLPEDVDIEVFADSPTFKFMKSRLILSSSFRAKGTLRLALPSELAYGVRYVFVPERPLGESFLDLGEPFADLPAMARNQLLLAQQTNVFPIDDEDMPDFFWPFVNRKVTITGIVTKDLLRKKETNDSALRAAEKQLPYVREGKKWVEKGTGKEVLETTFLPERDSHVELSTVLVGKIMVHAGAPTAKIERPTFTHSKPKPPTPPPPPQTAVEINKQWEWSQGNPKSAAVAFGGKLETMAKAETLTLQAGGHVTAHLMGIESSLLDAELRASAPIKADPSSSLSIKLLGIQVRDGDPVAGAKTSSMAGEWSKSITKEVSFRIPVGPIPVSGRVGVMGELGIRFFVGTREGGLDVQVTPFGRVTAFAEVMVDLLIVKFGVGGELTLISVELKISGTLALDKHVLRGPYLRTDAAVETAVEMLSGRLYIFLRIWLIFFTKEFRHDFCEWEGIKLSGSLLTYEGERKYFQSESDFPGRKALTTLRWRLPKIFGD